MNNEHEITSVDKSGVDRLIQSGPGDNSCHSLVLTNYVLAAAIYIKRCIVRKCRLRRRKLDEYSRHLRRRGSE